MNKIMVTKELQFITTEFDRIAKKPTRTITKIKDCLIWKPRDLHIVLRELIECQSGDGSALVRS